MKTFIYSLLLCAIGASNSFAQIAPATAAPTTGPTTEPTTRPAQTPVLADNTILQADVPYGGPDPKLNVLDIYAPKDAVGTPIVLFIHGGEWTRGDKLNVSSKPKFFNENNIAFVSVNYRLSPKDPHPAQVLDVARSIAWVREHAKEFGGDPNKIVIMGHSAGCHLATLVTLDPTYLAQVGLKPVAIRGTVAWSGGMYDLVSRAHGEGMYPPFIKATFGDNDAAQAAASPMSHVQNAKDCPPMIFASVDDAKSQVSRDASQSMVAQINAAGGKAQSLLLVGKTHFTANHELGASDDKTGPELLKWVLEQTK